MEALYQFTGDIIYGHFTRYDLEMDSESINNYYAILRPALNDAMHATTSTIYTLN